MARGLSLNLELADLPVCLSSNTQLLSPPPPSMRTTQLFTWFLGDQTCLASTLLIESGPQPSLSSNFSDLVGTLSLLGYWAEGKQVNKVFTSELSCELLLPPSLRLVATQTWPGLPELLRGEPGSGLASAHTAISGT